MRKLIVCNIMSLDGYYTGPGDDIMVMPIVPFQPTHLTSLYDVYRQMVAGIPHCRCIPVLSVENQG